MVPELASSRKRKWAALAAGALSGLAISTSAWAMPSFARQTGWSCAACHTSYPQLTPMGRTFKLLGYTTTNLQPAQKVKGPDGDRTALLLPRVSQFSLFFQANASQVAGGREATGLSGNPSVAYTPKTSVAFPDQVSLFYAGAITPHIGDFLHITYHGVDSSFGFDDSSIVWARPWKMGAQNLLVTAVDVNNTPTTTDLWNTTPDWTAPFYIPTGSPGAPSTFIEGALGAGDAIAGPGAYVADIFGPNRANMLYLDTDFYVSAQGTGTSANSGSISTVPTNTRLEGAAPYLRFAYQHDWGNWNWEVGTYGMWSRVYEGVAGTPANGPVDQFDDYDADSQLQWLNINDNSNLTVRFDWIHEDQSFGAGSVNSSLNKATLNSANLNASYWYHDHYGASAGYQHVYGSANPAFYDAGGSAGAVNGVYFQSPNGSPNTSDEWIEASYLPWWNTRFSIRYTMYNRYDGLTGATNTALSASKFNTIALTAWLDY